jgi:surfeit locus 1 family protein
MSRRLRGLIVLVAALAGMALTARLGVWQLSRASQKLALQRSLDERVKLPELVPAQLADDEAGAAVQHDRRIRLQGRWLRRFTVFLDNRQMDGRQGFFVVTPLQLEGSGRVVAVQRGFVPRAFDDRTRLPEVPTPPGEVTLVGRIAPPPGRLFEFAPSASGAIRQNLDLPSYGREIGAPLAPLSVVETEGGNPANDGLLRHWPHPAVDVQRNYGYAFQWFAMCALMAVLYVWFQLVRPRLRRRA